MEIADIKTTIHAKEERNMNKHKVEHFAHGRKHAVPIHERKGMISIQFDEKDWNVFKNAFGNEDEANAAIGIIYGAPPEIQILVVQLLTQIEKEVA